jgi:high-affinity iron transporter
MLSGFVLAFREGLEAALIISIVLGVITRLDKRHLIPTVWLGAAAGVVLSLGIAFVLVRTGLEFEGEREEVFEAVTMLLAAGILTWMVFWMQKSASGLRSTLETRVNQGQGRWQIFMISFLAVLREGVELALFLLAAGFAMENQQVLSGALLGLAAAIFAGLIWFRYSNRLALRKFFQITNIILLLFAAGLFALGIHELIELHVLPAIVDPLYDLSTLLPESSLPGTLLSALFGYRSAPALLEVGAFWGYLAVVLTILYRRNRPAEQTGE